MRDRRRLRQAIALHDDAARELLERVGHFTGQRRRTRETGAYRGEVALHSAAVCVGESDIHARRAGEERRALLGNGLEHVLGLELGHEGQLRGEHHAHMEGVSPYTWKKGMSARMFSRPTSAFWNHARV